LTNDYPINEINKRINKCKQKSNNPTPPPTNDLETRITIPFFRGVSEKISRILRRHEFQVSYHPGTKVSAMVSTQKDKVDPQDREGIYKVNCSTCSKTYIGETGRSFKVRLKEHQAALRNAKPNSSALALHVIEGTDQDHIIDWDNSHLIDFESRYWNRKYKEAIYINKHKTNSLNLDAGLEINPIWKTTLE